VYSRRIQDGGKSEAVTPTACGPSTLQHKYFFTNLTQKPFCMRLHNSGEVRV